MQLSTIPQLTCHTCPQPATTICHQCGNHFCNDCILPIKEKPFCKQDIREIFGEWALKELERQAKK